MPEAGMAGAQYWRHWFELWRGCHELGQVIFILYDQRTDAESCILVLLIEMCGILFISDYPAILCRIMGYG